MNKPLTREQKQRALGNLDIEVVDRLERFKADLHVALSVFQNQNEARLAMIPDAVRKMSMREFAAKYSCNLDKACEGMNVRTEPYVSPKKRKWAAGRGLGEGESSTSVEEDTSRARKSARIMPATPKRTHPAPTIPGSGAQRSRLIKTPGMNRVPSNKSRIPPPSPSPQKGGTKPSLPSFGLGRPTSPSKHHAFAPSSPSRKQAQPRVPSASTFNPLIHKAHHPTYPPVARIPRKDESMLSINGSPLANPYDIGVSWFADDTDRGEGSSKGSTLKVNGLRKTKSVINIRPDSSSQKKNGLHSRTNSKAGPSAASNTDEPSTPKPSHMTRTASGFALVAIPTKDGHFLEFDPLQTSPGALDALEGITDSAKKQAREEMGSLLRAAVDKWRIK